jgi:hypothetical protein
MIFLCKSQSWTPEALDDKFFDFIRDIEKKIGRKAEFIGHMAKRLNREMSAFQGTGTSG